MITDTDYETWVETKVKPAELLLQNTNAFKVDLSHMAHGVAGEAGELVDAIKKHTIYNKPLDMENMIEELGDLEFYMAHIRTMLGLTREQILEHNRAKLDKRYKIGYTDKAASERADKQDG